MESITKEEIVDVLNRIYVIEPEAAEKLSKEIKLTCQFRFTDGGDLVKCGEHTLGILDLLNGLFKTKHKAIRERRDESGELIHFIVARYEILDDIESKIHSIPKSDLIEAKRSLFSKLLLKCADGLTPVETKMMNLLAKDEDLKALLEKGF